MLNGALDDFPRKRPRLADTKSANGVSVKANFNCPFGGFFAQSGIHPALDDAEESLGRRCMCRGGPPGPPSAACLTKIWRASLGGAGLEGRPYTDRVFLMADG